MAAPQAGAEQGPASFITSIIPFALIIFIFYFLIIRPQNKKRKDTERMLSAIKKGDKVVTIGGIHGTVQSVKETTVIIKVDDNVKLEFLRTAVSSINASGSEKADKSDKTEKIEKTDSESDGESES
jgi:preprotein translocase subunit YajC